MLDEWNNLVIVKNLLTLAAIATALGLLSRIKWVRWVWHRNVTEPIKNLVQSAVRPMIEELDTKNTQQHADGQRMHREWRETVTARFDTIDVKIDGIDERTTAIEKYLTDPHKSPQPS